MASSSLIERIQLIKSNSSLFAKFSAQVDAFMSLCSTSSMRSTAKAMHISLGGVSYKLKTIENLLNAKLFVRKGRSGLILTDEGKELQKCVKTGFFSKEQSSNTEDRDKNVIRISAHPLASSYYVLLAVKKVVPDECKIIDISVCDREEGCNALLTNKTDILVYPFEWSQVADYKDKLDFIKLKTYDLVLYINKKNVFSKKTIDEITWSDAMKMNLVPRNNNVQFSTANSFLANQVQDRANKVTTGCIDLTMMYQGLIDNSWTMATGNEFEKIFDCSALECKNIATRQDKLGIVANWFVCVRKDKNNSGKRKEIEKIIKLITEEMNKTATNLKSKAA